MPVLWTPTFRNPDVRLDTDVAGVATSNKPEVACSAGNVFAVWEDLRAVTSDVFFQASFDSGATWRVADKKIPHAPPGLVNCRSPRVACSGLNVYVVWQDDRNGKQDIFFNRSADGGVTWLPADVRLDTDVAGAANSFSPVIVCDQLAVYVAWTDDRNGLAARDMFFNRSLDGGLTWLAADVRLSTAVVGTGNGTEGRLACTGLTVYAVWSDARVGLRDIHANRSLDGGATWLAADVRLDTDPAGGADSRQPRIACNGASAYVVWQDTRSGLPDVRFSRTIDSGATWLATDRRLDTDAPGSAASTNPVIACAGSDVWVAWQDTRAGNADILANRSSDGGATWLVADERLDADAAGTFASTVPEIAASGANVFVVWQDARNGANDVYMSGSADSGAHWTKDVRLDTDAPGAAASSTPRVACVGSRVYAVWADARSGNEDVYLNTSP